MIIRTTASLLGGSDHYLPSAGCIPWLLLQTYRRILPKLYTLEAQLNSALLKKEKNQA